MDAFKLRHPSPISWTEGQLAVRTSAPSATETYSFLRPSGPLRLKGSAGLIRVCARTGAGR